MRKFLNIISCFCTCFCGAFVILFIMFPYELSKYVWLHPFRCPECYTPYFLKYAYFCPECNQTELYMDPRIYCCGVVKPKRKDVNNFDMYGDNIMDEGA